MLQKLGVLSFSEPYWLDNIIALPWRGVGHDVIGRVSELIEGCLCLPGISDNGTGLNGPS